ncbi:MAG: ABC transporter permease [Coriobacteriia bacterium]|nr:ABC transporter permease [Coriobacteriia bacterium]
MMGGFRAFLGKEFREIVRTWRIWVIPGIVLFFALTGPVTAKVTPELLGTLMSEQQTGIVIQLPDPTYTDAYLQWTKNLAQIVTFVVIIVFGGMISSEKRSGTAVLVLTKPLSRASFVLAKFVSQTGLLLATVSIGAALTWGSTYAVFGEAPIGPLARATGAWLVLAVMFVALMETLSAILDSQAGAAGLGFAAYILISIATMWGPAVRHSPAGLVNAPTELAMQESVALGWPVATSLVAAALFVAATVVVFRRREL